MRPLISTTIVTFNRLDYTKKTVDSYLSTISVPSELFIVDNGSRDGTVEYLKRLGDQYPNIGIMCLPKNMYPGYACNLGWEQSDGRYLHRSDNDIEYLPGWDQKVLDAFRDFDHLGQLGLVNDLYQIPPQYMYQYAGKAEIAMVRRGKTTLFKSLNDHGTVSGTCVVPALIHPRWSEDRWDSSINEDAILSKQIVSGGLEVMQLPLGVVNHLGYYDLNKYPDYYQKTYAQRKVLDWLKLRRKLEQLKEDYEKERQKIVN